MDNLINLHIHSTGSDGKLIPEEVVNEAIKAGIKYICFTDHYFYPKNFSNFRKTFFSENYIKEIRRLQKKYKQKIDISFGVEMDWLPTYKKWIKNEIKKQNFDYVIGSIHNFYINGKYYFPFFGKDWKKSWSDFLGKAGGIKKVVRAYYSQIGKMAKSNLFDCVGHFDLIKLYNINNMFFSEKESWYRKSVIRALNEIKKSNIALEINTRGYIKYPKEQYPSFWILKEAVKRGIPITIGTDAHSTGEINSDIDKAYALVKKANCREIVRFKSRKRINIKI